MFAVSLVVPLLQQYYVLAGVASARQREFLSSLYSLSQIIGGLVLGYLSDSSSRRNLLLISFLGSAVAYSLIVVGSIHAIMLSRILVGLVKQTQTVSTVMITNLTSREDRAAQIAQLAASSAIAWIVGPFVGALLYKNIGVYSPVIVSCLLFVLNSIAAMLFLPRTDNIQSANNETCRQYDSATQDKISITSSSSSAAAAAKMPSLIKDIVKKFQICFASKEVTSVVMASVIYQWVHRTTSYNNMSSYYEEKFGLQPYHRGYLSSYAGLLMFLVQSFLVKSLLQFSGGEKYAACLASVGLTFATFLEIKTNNITTFCVFLCPMIAASDVILNISLRSLLSQVAPKNSVGSVVAGLDVLVNAVSVSVPFYRTLLFTAIAKTGSIDKHAAMDGDPDPNSWLWSSTLHWLFVAIIFYYVLLHRDSRQRHYKSRFENMKNI